MIRRRCAVGSDHAGFRLKGQIVRLPAEVVYSPLDALHTARKNPDRPGLCTDEDK